MGGLHAWLKGALVTFAVVDFLMAAMKGSLLWIYAAMEGGVVFSDLQLNAYDIFTLYVEQLLWWLYMISYVVAGFLFCRFIYRAIDNLDMSKAHGTRMPPGWAVAYNFIPIMNFWKPLQAMSQAWRGSLDPERSSISLPQAMVWWWAFWLASTVLAAIGLRTLIDSGATGPEIVDFEAFKLSLWFDILTSIASILSVVFLLPVISGIAKAQDGRRAA